MQKESGRERILLITRLINNGRGFYSAPYFFEVIDMEGLILYFLVADDSDGDDCERLEMRFSCKDARDNTARKYAELFADEPERFTLHCFDAAAEFMPIKGVNW